MRLRIERQGAHKYSEEHNESSFEKCLKDKMLALMGSVQLKLPWESMKYCGLYLRFTYFFYEPLWAQRTIGVFLHLKMTLKIYFTFNW